MSKLFVLAGPSGVGKGTVVSYLREHYPNLVISTSATTRSQRPGEVPGRDYIFLSEAEFAEMIEHDGFLEWAQVHGKNYYGTPREAVTRELALGHSVLVEIDLAGAHKIRSSGINATYIFLAPPSWDELERRLRGRGTEDETEIERRLQTARAELAAQKEFDVIVVNNTVPEAARKIASIIGLD